MQHTPDTHPTELGHCIVINVPGTPRPQPRPRIGKGRIVATMDPRAKRWSDTVESAAKHIVDNLGGGKVVREMLGAITAVRGKRKLKVPLELRAVFRIPTKDETRWGEDHEQTPDFDNLIKLPADALCRAGALGGDDGRISRCAIVKLWCSPREAGATFEIRRVVSAKQMPDCAI